MSNLEGLAKACDEEIHRLELRVAKLESQINDLKADRNHQKSARLQPELLDGPKKKEAQPWVVREAKAAHMLDVSVAALRRWRRERRGPPFVRMGRAVGYRIRDLESFLEADK